mgnify:CR=1 FL=1
MVLNLNTDLEVQPRHRNENTDTLVHRCTDTLAHYNTSTLEYFTKNIFVIFIQIACFSFVNIDENIETY